MLHPIRISAPWFVSDVYEGSMGAGAEPSLSYNPPYACPVDDHAAWLLVRHLHPLTDLEYDVLVQTPLGAVSINFVIKRGGHRVGLVLSDGEELEQARMPTEGIWRSLVMSAGRLDAIYVIEGRDLVPNLVDALLVIAGWQPGLFSPDGLAELSAQATTVGDSFALRGTGTDVHLTYSSTLRDTYAGEEFEWSAGSPSVVVVRRVQGGPLHALARVA